MWAFGIGYIGSVDYIATTGPDFYPFGYLPTLILLIILARAAVCYRLNITPSFAAKNIVDTMGDALVILGEDGSVALTNQEARTLLGGPEDELLNRSFADVTPWDLAKKNPEELARLCPIKDEPVSLYDPQGKEIHLVLSVSLMEERKRIQAFVCLFRDVTQKKIAEEQLHQAHDILEKRVADRTRELEKTNSDLQREAAVRNQIEQEKAELIVKSVTQSKLASLGEIAPGIAHEINQPLSYIKIIFESTLRDMREKNLDQDELTDDCRESLKQIGRITAIINHLRTFGRSDDATLDNDVNLKEVLDNTLILMGQRLRLRNIQHSIEIAPDIPTIHASSVKLEQVFINLLQNSVDALEGRDNSKICIKIGRTETNLIIIFADNGAGIPSDIQGIIFDPFFTSKEVGKGTGLGLSVTYGIIKEHQGSIELDPSTPGWTTFVIILPLGAMDN